MRLTRNVVSNGENDDGKVVPFGRSLDFVCIYMYNPMNAYLIMHTASLLNHVLSFHSTSWKKWGLVISSLGTNYEGGRCKI